MLSSAQRHYALALLTLTYVFNFLDRQLLAILLEPIKNEFNVSDSAMGLLYGLTFSIFYATLSIPIARLADRHSRRNILAIAAGLWSLMTMFCGLALNYTQMLLLRIGVAVGESGGVPPSQSLVIDYYPPEQRTRAMAIFSSATFIGTLLAMVVGAIIAQQYGWRSAFFIVGFPGVLLALLIRFTLKEPVRGGWDGPASDATNDSDSDSHNSIAENNLPQQPQQNIFITLKNLCSQSAMRNTLIACGFASIAGYGLGFWVPAFLIRVHNSTLVEAGVMVGAMGASVGLIGSLVGGWLCDKMAKRDRKWLLLIPAISLLLSFPILLAFLYWPVADAHQIGSFTIPSAIFIFCLAGFVGSWWAAPTYIVVQELVAPEQRTLACALLLFILNLVGFGLGPLLVGVLSDLLAPTFAHLSVRYALMIVMSSYLLAIVFYYLASKDFGRQRYQLPQNA